ncbi:hypothetical protein [Kitasatospora sp. McL0602]|uniref:hypothetical protein n=1 Tax=Kitasatospora sp. McL0602 TaxID=3439530 RepID=UPI003F8B27BB
MTDDTPSSRPAPSCDLVPTIDPVLALTPAEDDGPRADCVHCGEPTELPADHPGLTLCPVCTWQEAQRIACSG